MAQDVQILTYPVMVVGTTTISLPKGALVLGVMELDGVPSLLALGAPSDGTELYTFESMQTGEPFSPAGLEYIGTALCTGGTYVLHLYLRVWEPAAGSLWRGEHAVYKYKAAAQGSGGLFHIPQRARILSLQMQGGTPQIWAQLDPGLPFEARQFAVIVTGDLFDLAGLEYVGTYLEGKTPLHLFAHTGTTGATGPAYREVRQYLPQPGVDIDMPEGGQFLGLHGPVGAPALWALVDPDAPPRRRRLRYLTIEEPIMSHEAAALKYIGPFQPTKNGVKWHLFEEDLSFPATAAALPAQRPASALPPPPPPSPALLKGRYRVVSTLGRGGFGAVYKAEDTAFHDRAVAVKEIDQRGLQGKPLALALESFERESLILGGLMHPHLPRVYDQFTEDACGYLVMDYIEGTTLEQYVQGEGGTLGPAEVLDIGLQLCDVLDYLHGRRPSIIFRDLKPTNILRTPGGHLYLIDFGIARHFKPGQAKDTVAMGSPGYAAPEQYNRAQTSPRSDIYSLGVLLHQLLSGEDPTEAQVPFRFSPLRLGEARLELLVAQMVEVDPQMRPQNVGLVTHVLREVRSHI